MTLYHSFPGLEIDYEAPAEEHEVAFLNYAKEHPDKLKEVYQHIFIKFMTPTKYEKALEYNLLTMSLCKNNEELAEQYSWQSMIYHWWDKLEESHQSILKAVELYPLYGEHLDKLGDSYLERKDIKNALATYARMAALPDDAPDAEYYKGERYQDSMAKFYAGQKDYKSANKMYNQMLKEAKDDVDKASVYSQIASFYEEQSNYKDAIANAKKAVKFNSEQFAFIDRLARLYKDNNQFDEAKKTYKLSKKLIEAQPYNEKNFKRHCNRGLAEIALAMNNIEEAIEYYKIELTLYTEPKEAQGSLEQISALLFQQRRYAEAEPYVLRLIELFPNKYPRAYSSMATISYREKKDPENALNYLLMAKKANCQSEENKMGNDAESAGMIYGFIGKIYDDDYNDKEQAIENYEKALLCEPAKNIEGEICDALYKIYMERGEEEKAKEYKEKRSPIKMLQSMFSGDWTAPPAKTLDERLRNPKNTDEEIQGLPYHYSKLPKDAGEQLKFKIKMQSEFENDLKTNPLYKEYFEKHNPDYNRDFIIAYSKHKLNLVEQYKWWIDPEDSFRDIIFREERESLLEMVLQKKLFNMQLLWRAEQITIPEIKIANDFETWEYRIFQCPFLEPITEQEIAILKEYILDENFIAGDHRYMSQWQHYGTLMDENEDGVKENMPAWYEFYDEKMNTGNLMLLPEIRGEKEGQYIHKYWEWKNRQPPDVPITPAVPYVYLLALYGSDEHYTEFVELFENDYICNFHNNYLNHKVKPDKEYDEDDVASAIDELAHCEQPPIMEGGLPWHQAIIKCANKYKNKKLAAHLDETYADYKMKLELNLPFPESIFGNEFGLKNRDMLLDMILKAREVNGEPRDTNF